MTATRLVGIVLAVVEACNDPSPVNPRDTDPPPVGLAFSADDEAGEAVALVPVLVSAEALELDVVTRGFEPHDAITALGFRLHYDASILELTAAEPGPAWKDAVTPIVAVSPGWLIAGVAHPRAIGEGAPAPAGDLLVFHVRFRVLEIAPTTLTFPPRWARAFVVRERASGTREVAVRFVGGELLVDR